MHRPRTTCSTAATRGTLALIGVAFVSVAFVIVAFVSVALITVVGFASPASAEPGTVGGTMESVDGDVRTPVEGAEITVELDGEVIGTAVSDADGAWSVPVPDAGTYLVRLDVESLPDGIAPSPDSLTELPDVSVRSGQDKTVRFRLGPGVVSTVSNATKLLDLTVLGLKLGGIIAMSAVGLSLIFGVTQLVNFAHGELVTLGAVAAFFFHASGAGPGWSLLVAAVPAVLIVAAFGGAQEKWLWAPLRRRQSSNIAMLVISIGLSFAIQNIVLVIFGGEPKTYTDYAVQTNRSFLGIETVPKNVAIIVSSLVILGAVGLFLQKTRMGVALRAVADNKDLAESSGIDVSRVILVTWIMGTGLAALGGVYLGLSETIQWNMGFKLVLLIFAAVVLGGLGTAYGAMLGGFVIGLSVELSTFWISNELKNAVALAILIAMLLIRPQGLLGTKERLG